MFNHQATPEFKQWFSTSAAVTGKGAPLELFHGTDVRFSEFKVSARGLFGAGIYLTPYSGNAQDYGQVVMKVYAALMSPLRGTDAEIKAMRERGQTDAEFTEMLKRFGFDGIIIVDACGDPYTVVAFTPGQVKIAAQNIWDVDFTHTGMTH